MPQVRLWAFAQALKHHLPARSIPCSKRTACVLEYILPFRFHFCRAKVQIFLPELAQKSRNRTAENNTKMERRMKLKTHRKGNTRPAPPQMMKQPQCLCLIRPCPRCGAGGFLMRCVQRSGPIAVHRGKRAFSRQTSEPWRTLRLCGKRTAFQDERLLSGNEFISRPSRHIILKTSVDVPAGGAGVVSG